MNRLLYIIALISAISIFIFFYFMNFDNTSETELLNKCLYWYAPMVFGIFGLFGLRLKESMTNENNTIVFMFSGKDRTITTWTIILLMSTLVLGVLLFFVPLALIKPKSRNYDLLLAITGTLIWLVALWFFFEAIWPSL